MHTDRGSFGKDIAVRRRTGPGPTVAGSERIVAGFGLCSSPHTARGADESPSRRVGTRWRIKIAVHEAVPMGSHCGGR